MCVCSTETIILLRSVSTYLQLYIWLDSVLVALTTMIASIFAMLCSTDVSEILSRTASLQRRHYIHGVCMHPMKPLLKVNTVALKTEPVSTKYYYLVKSIFILFFCIDSLNAYRHNLNILLSNI